MHDLEAHPKLGASFEGFVISHIRRFLKADDSECYFWATHAGAELDLLIIKGRHRFGFEIKRTGSPKTTRSMHIAINDLKLHSLQVIHAGDHTYPMADNISAVSIHLLPTDLASTPG